MSEVYDEPIVVRLTVPVGSYPVGTEFGFKDVADAIRVLGSSAYFTVVRTQDGDPIPPLTPEDLTEAERQALARARAARLIRGGEFDKVVPGPGELVVGGPSGPYRVKLSDLGIDWEPPIDEYPEVDRTLSVLGDMHIGLGSDEDAIAAGEARIAQTFADLANLSGTFSRVISIGDIVETPGTTGTTPSEADQTALQYLNGVGEWDAVPGNHDFNGSRTLADWRSVYGYESQNWVKDYGPFRVIGIATDSHSDPTLSSETLGFIDTTLAESSKDTVIVCHYPLFATVGANPVTSPFTSFTAGSTEYVKPDADIRAILDSHPHARVWLCGHRHPEVTTAPRPFIHAWTGSRHIAVINAGSPMYTDYRVGAQGTDPARSIFLTMHRDHAEVRVRNHRDGVWDVSHTMPFAVANEEQRGNPATLVASFAGSVVAESKTGPVTPTIVGAASYDSTAGRTGLVRTSSQAVEWDPQPYIGADEGTVVVRARFTGPAASMEYLVRHDSGTNNRIFLIRTSDGRIAARMGDATLSAYGLDPITDTDIHTFGLSWRKGWHGVLTVDGVVQGETRTSAVATPPIEIGTLLRTSSLANIVLYDVFMSDRALSDGEHARLHAHTDPWTWDTLA